MKSLSFYHLTDLHYYANSVIGSSGKIYERKAKIDQKCMNESEAIIDSAFKNLLDDKDTDIVLISGDLTFDGEKQSHDSLVEKLTALKKGGKRVFITFATHDFYMHARKYTDEQGVTELPKYTRAQLRALYNDFGYSDAIAEHENSYSYCVQLSDDVRLLCLNDDGDFDEFCGYYNDLLFWIKEQVEKAHKDGCEIFAMTHHPVIDPSPIYPLFSHKAMLGGYETTTPYLADLGIKYIFVGHTHVHDVDYLDSKKGNRIYQINTASLIAYPLAYRKCEFSDEGMDVKTLQVKEIDFDLGGKDVIEYAKEHFLYMVTSIFDSLENDFDTFLDLSDGFSGNREKLTKFKPILQKLGKIVNGMTFGKICKLFGLKKCVDPSIADANFVEFICEAILNMYGGTEHYSPDTPQYKAFIPLCKRLGKVIKLKDHAGNPVDLGDLMAGVIYDGEIDDWNCLLK
ncbi:MAG: metallophosphoesterase family protein [Acutalibacteraceae bacterium]